jgi:predicted DNA-binding transcriptional regulator AlpA
VISPKPDLPPRLERALSELRDALAELVEPSWVDLDGLAQMLSCGRTSAWAISHKPGFPQPARLTGRLKRWSRLDVEQWLVAEKMRSPTGGRRAREMGRKEPSGRNGNEHQDRGSKPGAPNERSRSSERTLFAGDMN